MDSLIETGEWEDIRFKRLKNGKFYGQEKRGIRKVSL